MTQHLFLQTHSLHVLGSCVVCLCLPYVSADIGHSGHVATWWRFLLTLRLPLSNGAPSDSSCMGRKFKIKNKIFVGFSRPFVLKPLFHPSMGLFDFVKNLILVLSK